MNIVHVKIPMNETNIRDDFKVSSQTAGKICETLGEDYKVIISPFDITMVDGDSKVITIDYKEYSYNELVELIKLKEKN